MPSSSSSRSGTRRGSLAVEMALCMPLLLLLLFGSYEMSRANMILHATESAAYEGARVGILPGASKEKITAATSQILRSIGISDFQVDVSPAVIRRDTPVVEVTVRVPFAKNTSIPTMFIKNPTFRGVCSLTREIP